MLWWLAAGWPDFVVCGCWMAAFLILIFNRWHRVTIPAVTAVTMHMHSKHELHEKISSSQHTGNVQMNNLQELTTYAFVHSYATPCIVNEMDSSSSEKEWSLYLTDCRAS